MVPDRNTGSEIKHEVASQIATPSGLHPDTLLRSRAWVVMGGAAVQPFDDGSETPGRTDGTSIAELREKGADKNTLLNLDSAKDSLRDIQNVFYMPVLPLEPYVAVMVTGGANVAIPNVRPNLKARPVGTVGPRSCGQALVEAVSCRLGPSPSSYTGQIFDFQNGTDYTLTSEDVVVLIWVQASNGYVGLTGKCC